MPNRLTFYGDDHACGQIARTVANTVTNGNARRAQPKEYQLASSSLTNAIDLL